MHEPIAPEIEAIGNKIIGAAIEVHRALGPGLVESVYETCLCHELALRGVAFQRQVAFPILYREIRLDTGLRIDLLVEECVIVELKSVDKPNPLFDAQVLTYLKLAGKRLGLLINFNVPLLKDGIKRLVR